MLWRRGSRPHPSLISPGWELRSLRLLRYSSKGQCRLCLCRQVRRVSICSPGSGCIVSLRCTEPDLGPVAMTTTGTNHGCGPVVLQGQIRARVNAGLRARRHRQWAALGSTRQCRLRAVAQERGGLGLGGGGNGLRGNVNGNEVPPPPPPPPPNKTV